MRVVDQTLPTDRRPWLLKVDPHDDVQVILGLVDVLFEKLGVFQSCLDVVDAAWPDDHKQPIVVTPDDCLGTLSTGEDCILCGP